MATYNVGNFKDTYLAASLTDSATSMSVSTGSGASMPDAPCLAIISKSRSLYDLKRGEIIKVTAKASDTFTIERAQSGTTAKAHSAGELVLFNIFAEHISFTNSIYETLTRFIAYALGNSGTGILRTTYNPCTDLQVTENVPDMTVNVLVGQAMINFVPVRLATEFTTAAITAPTGGNSRIDLVQIDENGSVEIKTGTPSGSPSAPSADADAIPLATILLTTGMTQITNGDITDAREFY